MEVIQEVARVWSRALVTKWIRRIRTHNITGAMQRRVHPYFQQLAGGVTFHGAEIDLGTRKRQYGVFIAPIPFTPEWNVAYAPKGSPRARSFFFTEGFYGEATELRRRIVGIFLSDCNAAIQRIAISKGLVLDFSSIPPDIVTSY